MLFNSFLFIYLFLPLTFAGYFFLNSRNKETLSKLWLFGASLFFYGWWNANYAPLILGSVICNYYLGRAIALNNGNTGISKKTFLFIGLSFNLGLLGFFKYADFLIINLNNFSQNSIPLPNIILPLAISFFTFQQIAYLVDVYKGKVTEHSFITYGVFICFFPQLIAGPIVHHSEMIPQFLNIKNKLIDYRNIATGIFIFTLGLFKKLVIADHFSLWVTPAFDEAASLTFIEGWAASLSYTFQIYFDFSGYMDMATGAALLFNIKMPINFNSPYRSLSIREFWRRWHVTLGRFLKDYLYIPLGGNQKGEINTYRNLLITLGLAGLWHGAAWSFVVWGGLHGLALVVHKLWLKMGVEMNKYLAWFLTFNFLNFSWVIFRANEWDDAIKIFRAMFGLEGIGLRYYQFFPETGLVFFPATVIGVFLILGLKANSNHLTNHLVLDKRTIAAFFILFYACVINLSAPTEFLYFRF
jgi:alginate O-acetyltransferase complex protein AlgI